MNKKAPTLKTLSPNAVKNFISKVEQHRNYYREELDKHFKHVAKSNSRVKELCSKFNLNLDLSKIDFDFNDKGKAYLTGTTYLTGTKESKEKCPITNSRDFRLIGEERVNNNPLLVLPALNDETLLLSIILHNYSHLDDTDFEIPHVIARSREVEHRELLFHIVNDLEDIRIEIKVEQKYPKLFKKFAPYINKEHEVGELQRLMDSMYLALRLNHKGFSSLQEEAIKIARPILTSKSTADVYKLAKKVYPIFEKVLQPNSFSLEASRTICSLISYVDSGQYRTKE